MARTAFDIFGEESDTGIPPEGEALLNAIAENESAGDWNVIYGGSTFDSYADHPRKAVKITSGPNKGKTSSAAGKFQILGYVFDDVAKKIGVTDFTPESQKKVAWYLIREKYKFNDAKLMNDLRSGDVANVGRKLSGLWTSLAGGIEATQSDSNFNSLYNQYLELEGGQGGDDFLPPEGMATDSVRGFKARESFNELLPATEAKLSPKRQKEQQGFIESLTKAMDQALVVPKGMRPVESASDKKFASVGADLALAGSEFLHILAPQMIDPTIKEPEIDYTIPLQLPKPLTLGDAPAANSKLKNPVMTAENFIAEMERGERLRAPTQTTNAVRPEGPAAGMPAAKATSNLTGVQYDADARLIKMAQDMQRAQAGELKKSGVIKTSGGLAGSAELPKDYKPAPNLMPSDAKKAPITLAFPSAVRPEGPAAGMPAAKSKVVGDRAAEFRESQKPSTPGIRTGAYKLPQIDLGLIKDKPKPVSPKQTGDRAAEFRESSSSSPKAPVKVRVPQSTVYANPVSLSNPVLKAPAKPVAAKPTTTTKTSVAAQPQIPPKSGLGMSQTTTKPAATTAKPTPAQMAAMDSLAGLTTTPPKKPMPGIVEVGTLPPAKPVAKPVTVAPKPVAKPPVQAPVQKPVAAKAPIPLAKPATIQELQDAAAKKAPFAGNASLLDVVGDLLFNQGEQTIASVGSLLEGNGPAKNVAKVDSIKANIAAGKPVTKVDQARAGGLSPSEAYDYVKSQNNSKATSKTTTSGESWASAFGDG